LDQASIEMWQHLHPYIYPPPTLLLSWPFAQIPFPAAHAVFLILSHLCYLAAIWLLLTKLTPLPASRELRDLMIGLSLVYLFLFDPALVTLEIGQINLITLLFLCLALVAIRKDAPGWQIALPLSLAILWKTYPVLLLIPLVLRRRWSAVALTCLFFASYTALAAVVFEPEVWSTWWREVVPKGGYTKDPIAVAGPWNQDINGFVTRLFLDGPRFEGDLKHDRLAKGIATGLAGIVFGVTTLAAFRSRHAKEPERGDFEMGAFLLMIFLVAPISWDHHLVYVLPAALLSLTVLFRGELKRTGAIAVTAALFVIAWRVPLWEPPAAFAWSTLLISMKFYAAVALWVFFVVRLWRFGSNRRGAEATDRLLSPVRAHASAGVRVPAS
jgi:alpha-1,2-mannosyltransferase